MQYILCYALCHSIEAKIYFCKKLNLLFCKILRLKLFVTPELNSPPNRISKMRFSNSSNPTFVSNKPNNLNFIILRFSTNQGSVQGRIIILHLRNCQLVELWLSKKLSELFLLEWIHSKNCNCLQTELYFEQSKFDGTNSML